MRPEEGKEKMPQAAVHTTRVRETPALDLHCKAIIVTVDHHRRDWRNYFVRFLGMASRIRCFFHSCLRVASVRL